MPQIDSATYRSGVRLSEERIASQADAVTSRPVSELTWIGLYRPTGAELRSAAERFGLHRLAVADASSGHQRSKLERYGDTLFVVLRTARWIEDEHRVEFGELDLFVGPAFLVSVRHAESPDLAAVRRRLEANPALLALGPEAVLYAVLDQVVDEYAPIVARLESAVDALEDKMLRGAPEVARHIYDLLGQVIEFQRAVHPLTDMLERLRRGAEKYDVEPELRSDLRNVLDHVLRVTERADSFRVLLQNALTLHSTIVSQQQNEGLKKISAWAAIFFGPTLIATIYGMNFENMPELHWKFGYPLAVVLMFAAGAALYVMFRRRKWL